MADGATAPNARLKVAPVRGIGATTTADETELARPTISPEENFPLCHGDDGATVTLTDLPVLSWRPDPDIGAVSIVTGTLPATWAHCGSSPRTSSAPAHKINVYVPDTWRGSFAAFLDHLSAGGRRSTVPAWSTGGRGFAQNLPDPGRFSTRIRVLPVHNRGFGTFACPRGVRRSLDCPLFQRHAPLQFFGCGLTPLTRNALLETLESAPVNRLVLPWRDLVDRLHDEGDQ